MNRPSLNVETNLTRSLLICDQNEIWGNCCNLNLHVFSLTIQEVRQYFDMNCVIL